MNTIKTMIIVLGLSLWSGIVSAQNGEAIVGIWLSEDKDGKIQIYKVNDRYYGKLLPGKNLYETDGKTPKKDTKNSDAKLRERTLIGLVMLTNFVYKDGEWTGGEIYDPKSGDTYSGKMKLKNNMLELRGYIGTPLLGRTTTWTRTQP